MIKISTRLAFLLAIPTIIPLIFIFLEYSLPKKETITTVRDKSSSKGYKVYFKVEMANVSSQDYYSIAIGDTVSIKTGKYFNTVTEFNDLRLNETVKTSDSLYSFIIGFMLVSPLLVIFWSMLLDSSNELFSDSKNFALYLLLLIVSYTVIIIFFCVQVSPKE